MAFLVDGLIDHQTARTNHQVHVDFTCYFIELTVKYIIRLDVLEVISHFWIRLLCMVAAADSTLPRTPE